MRVPQPPGIQAHFIFLPPLPILKVASRSKVAATALIIKSMMKAERKEKNATYLVK